MEKAMEKIRDEMAARPDALMAQRIGEYLTGYLRKHPQSAGALAEEGKSLEQAMQALEAHARKLPRSGSCVVMEDGAAYAVILDYYGLAGTGGQARGKAPEDTLDLDALLGI